MFLCKVSVQSIISWALRLRQFIGIQWEGVGLADFWHYERSVLPALKLSATLVPEGWNPTVPADFYDEK